MLATSDAAARGAIVGLLIVALIAFVVYVLCRAAGRPDWGALGACAVAVIGGLLVLLEYV